MIRTVHNEDTMWYAYLVVHPITKVPLYAGMTAAILDRSVAHKGPSSRIRSWLRELGDVDLIPEVVIVGRYETKDEALEHELKLITETPGLLNRIATKATGRPRLGEEANTNEARKPWLELGMSRRTWYSRQAEKRVTCRICGEIGHAWQRCGND